VHDGRTNTQVRSLASEVRHDREIAKRSSIFPALSTRAKCQSSSPVTD